MTNVSLSLVAGYAVDTPDPSEHVRPSPFSLKRTLRSIGEKFMAAQQRRVEREVALYLQTHGNVLSDDMERQISRQFKM